MAKKKVRESGARMKESGPFAVREQDFWRMDLGGVEQRLDKYLREAAESGKYSIAGLCIALSIPRGQLSLWREGYVCGADARDAGIAPCERLSRCVEMALLHIQRHWEERDKPSAMDVKQLEATGALGDGAPASLSPPFDLGKLKKYAQ